MSERVIWAWDGVARVLDVDGDEGDMAERARVDVSDLTERAAMALMLNLSHALHARRGSHVRQVPTVRLENRERDQAQTELAPVEGVTRTAKGGRRLASGKVLYPRTFALLREVVADPGQSSTVYGRRIGREKCTDLLRALTNEGLVTRTGPVHGAGVGWYPSELGQRVAAS